MRQWYLQRRIVTPDVPPAPALLADVVDDARLLDQPSNADRLDALQALLRKRGHRFTLQPFPNVSRQRDPRDQGQNVVLDDGGTQSPEIVVGAHLNAVPLERGGHSHGMVDNAAGVVVLTRLAETLRTRRLRHRIRIVFFDMEENGLQGSRHYVGSLDWSNIRSMVNVDIAGYGDTILSGPTAAAGTMSLHRALARACATRNLNVLRLPVFPTRRRSQFPGGRNSGHLAWHSSSARGAPGVAPVER